MNLKRGAVLVASLVAAVLAVAGCGPQTASVTQANNALATVSVNATQDLTAVPVQTTSGRIVLVADATGPVNGPVAVNSPALSQDAVTEPLLGCGPDGAIVVGTSRGPTLGLKLPDWGKPATLLSGGTGQVPVTGNTIAHAIADAPPGNYAVWQEGEIVALANGDQVVTGATLKGVANDAAEAGAARKSCADDR